MAPYLDEQERADEHLRQVVVLDDGVDAERLPVFHPLWAPLEHEHQVEAEYGGSGPGKLILCSLGSNPSGICSLWRIGLRLEKGLDEWQYVPVYWRQSEQTLLSSIMVRWGVVVLFLVGALRICRTEETYRDFGIVGAVQGSADVRLEAIRLGQTFDQLATSVNYDFTAPSSDLERLFTAMTAIVESVTPLGLSLAAALASATLRTFDLEDTFESIVAPLVDLQTAIVVQVPQVVFGIEDLVGQPFELQVLDEINMIYVSSRSLLGAVIQLAANVRSANNSAQVNQTLVDRVRRNIMLLHANIQLFAFTISSTSRGINVANEYLVNLAAAVTAAQEDDRAALELFQSKLNQFEDSITFLTDCLVSDYANLRTDVSAALEDLGSASGVCVLQSAAESLVDYLTTDWDRVVCAVKRHYTLLGQMGNFTEELSASYVEVYGLGMAVALTAAANGPNALFCFNKYFRLVELLLLRLTEDAAHCLKQESIRLRSLQESLQHMFPTIVYDVEDLLSHLELCGAVLEQQDSCVEQLGALYEHLASQTHQKLKLIEKFSRAETRASSHRLKLCVLHSRYAVLHLELARLRNELEDLAFLEAFTHIIYQCRHQFAEGVVIGGGQADLQPCPASVELRHDKILERLVLEIMLVAKGRVEPSHLEVKRSSTSYDNSLTNDLTTRANLRNLGRSVSRHSCNRMRPRVGTSATSPAYLAKHSSANTSESIVSSTSTSAAAYNPGPW
uniref:Uncharacterized protein n=1 Tax=Anopheles atroparvus TaxID=41427 RepID=A0A182IXA3_ANOAO